MTQTIKTEPLTADAFAPFGDVLEASGTPDKIINQGFCGRFNDRAQMDFGPDGRAGLSIFKADPRRLPYVLDLVERHPDGSQAFIPMSMDEWLVIVASDLNGIPTGIRAFLAAPGQAINFHRNTWHGVLTPLHAPGLFAVVDRIGPTPNLQEHILKDPYLIEK
ncbi:ureidoglycolate lyase [Thalassovita litoralis]|jgi:ureidoglycolate lyase|uniref:Ureidoglycolate lyase n=1 Tax=Thalassovita litoralis TaxID=1010611 RepID=A0A521CEW4_9RHOB|nr:ureidoglycolate lyase [Thalassovita litoralis]SMO57968.1 ureidoglycolate lyase [Thalassovita litoralis]